MKDSYSDYGEMIQEIRTFIANELQPTNQIKGKVVEIDPIQNSLKIKTKKNLFFKPGNLCLLTIISARFWIIIVVSLQLNLKRLRN